MKRIFAVSYTHRVNSYDSTIRNVVSVITALSEDEALGIAYKSVREKYPQDTLINLMQVPDEHVTYAYNQLKKE